MKETTLAFPGLLQAALYTLLGSALAALLLATTAPWLGVAAAAAIAVALGLGSAGALVATRIGTPHGERVGLAHLNPRFVAGLACLLPVVLLGSEADNWVRVAIGVPAPTGDRIEPAAPLLWVETLILLVGLRPLVEEWFFRGLLQQGLIARHGALAGIVLAAILSALHRGLMNLGTASMWPWMAQTWVLAVTFGYARWVTGSLLAAVLLHATASFLGILAEVYQAQLPIAGFNAPGPHTRPDLLVASAVSVAFGARWLARIRIDRVDAVDGLDRAKEDTDKGDD